MKLKFYILLFCVITVSFNYSQNLLFKSITAEDGLSSSDINCLIQDKLGFIWIGSDNGLNRYDGSAIKVYRNPQDNTNSISDNSIWALYEDRNENIWIGTKGGVLNKYSPKYDKFERIKLDENKNVENSITSIIEDKEGFLWVGTYSQGLYRYEISTGKLKNWKYDPENRNGLSNNYVSSLLQDQYGYIWISTYNGLNRLNPNNLSDGFKVFFTSDSDKNSISNNLVWRISQSINDKNILWICTANGLCKYEIVKNKFHRLSVNPKIPLQFSNSFAGVMEQNIGSSNILWAATYGGLFRIDLSANSQDQFVSDKKNLNGLLGNQIDQLLIDRSGVLWIATDKGLNYHSSKTQKFNKIFSENINDQTSQDLLGADVKAILKNGNNEFFIAASEALYKINITDKTHEIKKLKELDNLNIWSLEKGSNNDLWIGTYGNGLVHFDITKSKLNTIQIESPTFKTSAFNYIKTLYHDNNNYLWMGFWGGGLARLDTKSGKYNIWITDNNNSASISHNDVWAIEKDERGRLWIGTNGGGLNLFVPEDGGTFFHIYNENNSVKRLSSNSLYDICESKIRKNSEDIDKTVLWIGTSNGLNKVVIKNSSDIYNISKIDWDVKIYGSENGLNDNSVLSIQEDSDGNLWVGTNSGISFFNAEKEIFINYSNSDGIIGNEFNSGSACFSEDGLMYFGSIKGLNIFDPKEIKQSNYIPPVVLTDFQILNKPVKIGGDSPLSINIQFTEKIELSYSQNVFSFQFSALDYNSPQSIHYAYKMEGFDQNWITSGDRRFISYTNLNPGTYTFKVKATNSDGVWSENYKSILVIIDAPWWRNNWAYLIYFLIIVFGLFAVRKFESNRTKLRNELRMREFETQKLKEIENVKSRFFANLSHEFRTPLTLIRGPVEELINGTAAENQQEYYQLIQRNSEKLQELIDQLLELTQLENAAIPLKARQENLVSILHGIFYSFDSLAKEKGITISLKTDTDKLICLVDRDKLEKIINNLLSNAFKFTAPKGIISLNIYQQSFDGNEFAFVKVADTGVGIPEDKLQHIFDRFYQVDDSTSKKFGGSGIGLALVKELVDLHKWNLDVKSEVGKGTEFYLRIPLSDTYLNENEKDLEGIVDQQAVKDKTGTTINDKPLSLDEEIEQEILERNKLLELKPLILIVEDSEDVRSYLIGLLKNDYRINEAVDGEDGIKKSSEVMPDLIISDVMMPLMDGFEFCRKIKTEWLTSHIPVILLTAKASTESKIEGLETGADVYLTKPFSSKELSVRIKNLLEQRKSLREKFSKQIKVEPAAISVNSLDNEFLKKAFDVAEKNLSNFEFNSESFAKDMFVSRSQLHRKLLAITGQAPGEFVRAFRLRKSASLILEQRLSITQIALEVGFNSPSHFTKAFRQQFNCPPTEFIERNNS